MIKYFKRYYFNKKYFVIVLATTSIVLCFVNDIALSEAHGVSVTYNLLILPLTLIYSFFRNIRCKMNIIFKLIYLSFKFKLKLNIII